MSRLATYAFAALLIAIPSLAIAQTTHSMQEDKAEAKELTDSRITVLKDALQLSPEQAKYWPAIEEAIRGRAEARRERLENFATRMREAQPDRNFVQVLQNRAENLSARGAELKKLADAWQPLYVTLTDTQKRRMRILAFVVLHEMRQDMEARHDQMMMMEDEPWGAVTGPGGGEFGRD
ncbi:Spy/CpxP family protein refolding chaperone [Hyphomicrobium sp.]|uniref:Spy/CpxP family protein refolding chaperone n=1 Tax=Hyphomicrobium sp. TaxID=82 RepID=UPI002E31A316|nr:Spy/CpxP family protein refolding chaperone [Hyphomicrobium sp.]HEX2841500.1 Spy/CpxP family protein refolding chaperone [Hyphomicrobium sp.]